MNMSKPAPNIGPKFEQLPMACTALFPELKFSLTGAHPGSFTSENRKASGSYPNAQ